MRWLAFALALGMAIPAAAQTRWPEKPVRLVVVFTPGSATEVTTRIFAQKFSEAWGQPVIVAKAAQAAKAATDGYTLMWSGNATITALPAERDRGEQRPAGDHDRRRHSQVGPDGQGGGHYAGQIGVQPNGRV